MERLFVWLLARLPARVRAHHDAEMRRTFRAQVDAARASGGRWAGWVVSVRECRDALMAVVASRTGRDPLAETAIGPAGRRPGGRQVMRSTLHDVRFGFRLVTRQPMFALTVILTLALGIGANTAVFSVIEGVMLRPLPYQAPDRLVSLFVSNGRSSRIEFSALDAQDLAQGARTLASMSIYNGSAENLTGAGEPQQLSGSLVSPNFFETLGAAMAVGRAFTASDPDGARDRVVISHHLWQSRFSGASDVVGKTMYLDGAPFTIAGVLQRGAEFPEGADYWRPIVWSPGAFAPSQRGARYLQAIGRLKPGVLTSVAQADLSAIYAAMTPARRNAAVKAGIAVVGLRDAQIEGVRPALLALGAAVIVLLLIACSNIANLMLTHGAARTGEVAVRASLGASRLRIVRQLLAESAVLASLGGAAGLFVAAAATRALLALVPAGMPGVDRIGISGPVLAFAAGLVLATSLLFGLLPAWQISRASLAGLTRASGTRSISGSGRVRRTLAVVEVGLAVMLLGSAGLLLQTMASLHRLNPGFDASRVLTFSVSIPDATYDSPARRMQFFDRLIPALGSLPGVEAAGIGAGVPFTNNGAYSVFSMPGAPVPSEPPVTNMRVVAGDYFRALRIPLLAGRWIDAGDRADSPLVAVVNERLVKRYFDGVNPIGRQIQLSASLVRDAPKGARVIVGVVGDVKTARLDEVPAAETYVPYSQQTVSSGTVLVRTTGEPMDAVPAVRARLKDIDASLPMADVEPFDALIGASAAEQRLTASLLTIFALVAAALAAVGLYGVFSVGVAQRTREIGIRMALGADAASVLRLFVREGLVLAVVGAALGLLGLRLTSGLLASLLVGVGRNDPLTFTAAAMLLTIVAMTACYVPARRASRVNPVEVLSRLT